MKVYDLKAAKRYVQAHSDSIKEASLGMKEDWFWTAKVIYKKDKFTIELDKDGTKIAGIPGSDWATPTLHVIFKTGEELFKDCFTGESSSQRPEWFTLGVLSGPEQERVDQETSVPKITQ